MGGGSVRQITRPVAGMLTSGASEAAFAFDDMRKEKKETKKALAKAAADQAAFEQEQEQAATDASARRQAGRRRDSARRRQSSRRQSGRQGTLLGGAGTQENEAGARTLLGS